MALLFPAFLDRVRAYRRRHLRLVREAINEIERLRRKVEGFEHKLKETGGKLNVLALRMRD